MIGKEGKPVSNSFEYSSISNKKWLTIKEIKSLDKFKLIGLTATPGRYSEQDKEKSENQKTHERYRRKQKSTESGMSLEDLIRPAKKIVEKPGTYFYGPLRKLAEEFGDIRTMTLYMTIGQMTKYSEENQCLYDRTGKKVYDEKTRECFE